MSKPSRAGSMVVILAEIERLRPLTTQEKETIRGALWPIRPGVSTVMGNANFAITDVPVNRASEGISGAAQP